MQRAEAIIWVIVSVATIVAGFVAVWQLYYRRVSLPPQRIRDVPWGAGWCLASWFIIYAGHLFLGTQFSNEARLIAAAAWFLPACAIVYAVMRWGYAQPMPFGSFDRRAITLGLGGWLLFGTATLIVHLTTLWIASFLGGPPTSTHELIRMVQGHGDDNRYWLLIMLEAAVCAPVREEIFFRGIVQPVAARNRFGGDLLLFLACVAGVLFRTGDITPIETIIPIAYTALLGGGLLIIGPFVIRRIRLCQSSAAALDAYRAIVGTAFLFAMFHVSYWPDPIALTVLGLGLGWLAWRTQGIAAPILCHALFNLTTLVQLRLIHLLNS